MLTLTETYKTVFEDRTFKLTLELFIGYLLIGITCSVLFAYTSKRSV